ncbi:glutamate receptor 2.8-like [Prunus yedoensis var. nudiflora]|uniref:Glutamate receptor 2.8-like n=1 Tax=Prunus yedoensis var. nudiflora TaxID=2094558 RepID=A0A314Y5M8_PRUYE|nr:glutamate receptor 2.8-like [Prunus yedoensis var. nudiflora]
MSLASALTSSRLQWKLLAFVLPFDFIPFAKPDGTSAGSYDDLCYQVYLGKFDAVVGDTTISADRSSYVDFTMPYTEAGVVMDVPVSDNRSKNAWAFLEPWTWDLWLTTCCFFIFIGFVVWVLQHRINNDFRGPPSHQVGTGVWFSFSTIVFSHSKYWTLLPSFCFDDSKIKRFRTMRGIDEALSKGSGNVGVAAVVDQTPNMKLFVAKYCSKYTMIGPIFKTDGFGFVFPKRSLLIPDVSQAILKVTGTERILDIEKKMVQGRKKLSRLE